MNEHEIRTEIHRILDSHADILRAVRAAHTSMQATFESHDAALVSAIDANSAALRLLNRIMDEGIEH